EVLGLTVIPMTAEVAKSLNLAADSKGLAITHVDPASEAATKGVGPGDVIVEAGQQQVQSVTDLQARIDEAKAAGRKSILLLVRREGDPRFVALAIE
ncbi:MAG: PDZ domain-containing protein, partial [Microgenomates group bacterium]